MADPIRVTERSERVERSKSDRPNDRLTDRSKKASFEVRSLEELQDVATPVADDEHEPGTQVKVKFGKFVQLVATHNCSEVIDHNVNEDIIMNSNLLMDLANAHEDAPPNRKMPTMFVVGLILGIFAAYILFKFF